MPNPIRWLQRVRKGMPRPFLLLLLTTFLGDLGMGIQAASYPNFMVEQLQIQPGQLGVLESIRELPGFILVGIAALTMRVAEPVLASVALLVESLGMFSVYFVGSVEALIAVSFCWSLGFHTYHPLNQSMALALAEEDQRGKRLGQLRSATALAQLIGMGSVGLIAALLGLRALFIIAGVSILLAAVTVYRIPRDLRQVEKPRVVVKRRYSLYYALIFLEGCRRQVFATFAVYALVQVYHASIFQISALMIGVNVANLILAPAIGHWIDRFGERRILTFYYVCLVPLFVGYATVSTLPVLFALYAADGVLMTLSLALTTYVDRIAEQRDVMPTLAMGVTMNHLAAVIVPVSGGLLWASYGYQLFFLLGAGVVVISLFATQRLPHVWPSKVTTTVS